MRIIMNYLEQLTNYQFGLASYIFDSIKPVDMDSKRHDRYRRFLCNPNNFDRLCLDERSKFCQYDGHSDIDNHSTDPDYKQILKLAIKNKKLKSSTKV